MKDITIPKLSISALALLLLATPVYAECGIASVYFENAGSRTASGERFNPLDITAAHKTRKFGTKVRVRNLTTGKTIYVRITDRGPFIHGRIIDLSLGAARLLGVDGLAFVCLD